MVREQTERVSCSLIHGSTDPTLGLLVPLSDRRVSSASLFTEQEIQEIRSVTFHHVLVAVTSAEASDLQQDVFFWRDGNCLEVKKKEGPSW